MTLLLYVAIILGYGLPISVVLAGIVAIFYKSRREGLIKYIKRAILAWVGFWIIGCVFILVNLYRFIKYDHEHSIHWDEKTIYTLVAGDTYDYTDFIEITRNDYDYSVDLYVSDAESGERLIENEDGSVTIPLDYETDVYVHIVVPEYDSNKYIRKFSIQN